MESNAMLGESSGIHRAASFSSETIRTVISSTLSAPLIQKTQEAHHVPLLFRENYIHSGYRLPDQSWGYYLRSLFQIHNESVNVWSHLVALMLFLSKIYRMRQEVDYFQEPLSWSLLAFALGTVSYSLFSTFAHLFQSKSKMLHYTCFQIDYIGIGMNGYGNACLLYYMTGTATYYRIFSSFFMPVNIVFAVAVCVCFSIAKLKYRRPYPFRRKLWQIGACSLHVLFGGTPLLFKMYECYAVTYDDCSARVILRHLEYTFWFAVSTFFFASHLPERFAPGKFDLFGHGHQLFHVIITYTSLLQYDAALTEYRTRSRDLVAMAAPDALLIFGGAVIILLVDALFIAYTFKHRLAKIQDDTSHEETHSAAKKSH